MNIFYNHGTRSSETEVLMITLAQWPFFTATVFVPKHSDFIENVYFEQWKDQWMI